MADLQVRNGKVVYLDENGDILYSLPTQVGTPGQSVIFDEDGNLAAGLGLSTLGSLSNVDSTADSAATGKVLSFNGVYWEAVDLSVGGVVFDSAYVQARQDFSYTSLVGTPNILDSTNVEAIIDADYVNSLGVVGTDSSSVIDIIATTVNNTYIRNRQDYAYSSLTGAPTNVSSFSNDAGYLTSATVGDVIDATYLDSADAIAIVNSAYVQARQDYNYSSLTGLPDFFDSVDAAILVDSNYVQLRQDYSYQSLIDVPDFFDSNDAIVLVDSDYVRARQDYQYSSLVDLPDFFDSNDATVLVDSAYVNARLDASLFLDSADAVILIDSDYVQARQDYSYGSLINLPDLFDSADATVLIDSDYVQARQIVYGDADVTSLVNNAYVQTRQDDHNLTSDASNTTVAANFIPDADDTRTLGSSSNRFSTIFGAMPVYNSPDELPDPGLAGEMGFIPSLQKIFISSGAGWFKIGIENRDPVLLSVTDSNGNPGPYELSINQNPTTIIVEAVDSDADPLTYTYVADSGFGDFASISQDDNVFVITPLSEELAPPVSSGSITFTVSDGLASSSSEPVTFTLDFRVDWANISLQQLIFADDFATNDFFGTSVALELDTAIVGAYGEDPGGINSAGSAYVFTRSGSTWTQQQKLTASDAAQTAGFGNAIALEGDTAIIAASAEDTGGNNRGAAYVFTRSGSTWSEQQKLIASDAADNDQFGYSVAISNNTTIIGAHREDGSGSGTDLGAAYIFTRDSANGSFTETQKLAASDAQDVDYFGASVAIDSDTAIVGAYLEDAGGSEAGAAYIFTRDSANGSFTQTQKLAAADPEASDYFGSTVDMDGNTIVVGAYREDEGAVGAGAAYIFTRDSANGSFTQEAKLIAADASAVDRFGYAVAIRNGIVVIGAIGEDSISAEAGAAYIFGLDSLGVNWEQITKIGPPSNGDGSFGLAVDVTLDTVIAGANVSGALSTGSVSVFKA